MTVVRSVILFLACSMLFASNQSDLKKKDQQLKRLRAEIEEYENQIQHSETKEKATLSRLDKIEQQSNLVRTLLNELRNEERLLRGTIDSTKENIDSMEKQLTFLRNHYAKYVSSVYKYGKVYDLETILSANSINQLYIRIEYLRRFSDQRKRDLEKIETKKRQIELEQSSLEEKLVAERQLITEKTVEERSLNQNKERRERVLSDIRQDKSELKHELTRKISAAKELENIIVQLIEQERIRKERADREEKERKERLAKLRAEQREREHQAQLKREKDLADLKKKNDLQKAKIKQHEIEAAEQREAEREKQFVEDVAEAPVGIPFGQRKGKLHWPVSGGRISARFGNQVHPVMKTITTNTGIDISTRDNSPIRTIADGEVALIHWLPSYGNLIIINHNNGFRTVYAHLSDISVSAGQKITEGQVIAYSGESVSGDMLHFEIWKEKEKQNPEEWLARR
jgi:murein hydrolase activator